jgi:hypothetical protein
MMVVIRVWVQRVSTRWSGLLQVAGDGACVRAGVVGGPGSRLAAGHPGGLALTPASDDAELSSGPDGRRGARARLELGVSHRGPHDLRMGARLGCRGIPSPIGLSSMVRSGHDQTGVKQFVDLAAGGGGHADHELASGRVRASRRGGPGEAAISPRRPW